jgi:hypothetical protein
MPMNVNEGMHNPGVPFFPVSDYLFIIKLFILIFIATWTTNDESSRNQESVLNVKENFCF